MKTASGHGTASDRFPAPVLISISMHAAALGVFILALRAAPQRAPRQVENVDLMILTKPRARTAPSATKLPPLSTMEFLKLALPAPKASRGRPRMPRPARPTAPDPVPEVTTRHGAAAARYRQVAERYRRAAEQGEVRAQFSLAGLYYIGHGVDQDYGIALSWYRKAAEQGDAMAQTNLGTMYYLGRGVPVNYEEAALWYRKAATQAYPAAQSILGAMHEEGHGVALNYAEALSWYRKAAEQGDAAAQYKLGIAYENGLGGLTTDDVKALKWYQEAANQDYEPPQPDKRRGTLWEKARAARAKRRKP